MLATSVCWTAVVRILGGRPFGPPHTTSCCCCPSAPAAWPAAEHSCPLRAAESSGAYSPPIAAGRLALPLGDGGSKGSTAITVQATAATAPAPQLGPPGAQGGAGAAHNAVVDSQLEEAPSALSEWEEAEGQLFVWLGMSIATLFLSVLALSFGTIAAVCGISGACTRVSWCRRGGLADEVKVGGRHGLFRRGAAASCIACCCWSGVIAKTTWVCCQPCCPSPHAPPQTTHVLAMLTAGLAAVMCLVSLSWSASISRL